MRNGKFINPLSGNIVLYITNKNKLIISEIIERCPICQSVKISGKFRIKNKGDLTIAKCEEEALHTYIFDHCYKENLPFKKRVLEVSNTLYTS